MVITKQQQIGGEGDAVFKPVAVDRDLTSLPNRGHANDLPVPEHNDS